MKSLRGETAHGKDLLNGMAEEIQVIRGQVEHHLEQACQALNEIEVQVKEKLQAFRMLVRSSQEYADATVERRRMILFEVIKRITTGKSYETKIDYKETVLQFLNGMQNRPAR